MSNAAAIILHHFAVWAGYKQQEISAAKFIVDSDAKVCNKRPIEGQEYQYTEYELEIKALRQAKRQAANEVETHGTNETIVDSFETIPKI